MAVANSLILSPMQRRSDYDPYHPDNLQQPRWIFQQPQRLIVGPSYAQRFGQPEYSSMHNTCVRPNDWMSNYPSSRVAQEVNKIKQIRKINSINEIINYNSSQ